MSNVEVDTRQREVLGVLFFCLSSSDPRGRIIEPQRKLLLFPVILIVAVGSCNYMEGVKSVQ